MRTGAGGGRRGASARAAHAHTGRGEPGKPKGSAHVGREAEERDGRRGACALGGASEGDAHAEVVES